MTESNFEHAARHITQLKRLLESDRNYSQSERDNWKKGLKFWLARLKDILLNEEEIWFT